MTIYKYYGQDKGLNTTNTYNYPYKHSGLYKTSTLVL